MQVRRKLTEFESTMAFVIGGGMALIMIAFALAAARGNEANYSALSIMLVIGALLFVVGMFTWLFVRRPWTEYDDWSVPHYTGEDHHDAPAPAHEEEHAEMHAIPAAQFQYAAAGEKKMMVAEATPAAEPAVAGMSHTATSPARQTRTSQAVTELSQTGAHMGAVETTSPEAITDTDEAATAAPTSQPGAPAAKGGPDKLTRVEGIGPKIAAALVSAGIDTFAKLAARTPEELEQTVKGAGVRMVGHATTWPKQAALAAEGKWEELDKLQRELRAGRE